MRGQLVFSHRLAAAPVLCVYVNTHAVHNANQSRLSGLNETFGFRTVLLASALTRGPTLALYIIEPELWQQ